MRDRIEERRPYQFSLGELLALTTACAVSLGLWRWAWVVGGARAIVATIGGLAIAGGVIGAIIGRAFEDDRGGVSSIGAYWGMLAVIMILAPLLLLALLSML